MRHFNLVIAAVCVMIAGCAVETEFPTAQEKVNESMNEIKDQIFKPTGDTLFFDVSMVRNWKIDKSVELDWATFSPNSGGPGITTIMMIAGLNDDAEKRDRFGTFIINGISYRARQEYPFVDVIDVEGDSLKADFLWYEKFGDSNNLCRFNIKSNTIWSFTAEDQTDVVPDGNDWKFGWLKLIQESGTSMIYDAKDNVLKGSGDATIVICPASENENYRRNKISLNLAGPICKSLAIDCLQDSLDFLLVDPETEMPFDQEKEYRFKSCNDPKAVAFVIKSDYVSNIDYNPSWMTKHLNDSIWIFKPDECNPGKEEQKDCIIIKVEVDNKIVNRKIKVVRDGFKFSVSSNNLDVKFNGDRKAIQVISDGEWEVYGQDSWVEVEQIEDSLIVSVPTTNIEDETRENTITLKSKMNNLTEMVKISQRPLVFNVVNPLGVSDIEPMSKGLSYVAKIVCSGTWKIDGNSDWIVPSVTSGEGDMDVEFTITKNNTNTNLSGRTASFKIICQEKRNKPHTINFSQKAYEFDSKSETFNFGPIVDVNNSVNVTCSGKWKVTECPDWITVSPSSGSGNSVVTIYVADNSEKSVRNGKFKIISDDNTSLSKTVTVKQDGYNFNVSASGLPATFNAVESNSVSIFLTCSGGWDLIKPDWIEASQTSGSNANNLTITLRAKDNNNTTKRSGTITVKSRVGNYSHTYNVSQDGLVFSVSKKTLNITGDTGSDSFTLKCMGPWTITADKTDSIKIDKTSGTGTNTNYSFTVKVTATKRTTATITLTVTSNLSGKIETITINQKR